MSIDVRVSHINVHQPANDATRKYNIDGVINLVTGGGVGTLNEIGKTADHRYIASWKKLGIDSYVYGELGVIWDSRRFEKIVAVKYRIMQGGHVGADGKPGGDSRRVGPTRWVLIVVLKDRATGITFQVNTTHLVARAFTKHKWRKGIFYASVAVAGLRINYYNEKYKNGVMNGDMNFIGPRLDFPHLAETQLPPLKTFGNQRYDRSYVWGNTKLVPGTLKTFRRRSDHLGFTFIMRIGDGPSEGVPPVSNAGSGVVRPGNKARRKPPVPRPWRRRSRRWKRRHPILWRRIKRWRRNHPRR